MATLCKLTVVRFLCTPKLNGKINAYHDEVMLRYARKYIQACNKPKYHRYVTDHRYTRHQTSST